jgi:uncharacterized protein
MHYSYFSDPTFLLLIPALLLTVYAQIKVHHTINKYNQVKNSANLTGHDVAKKILSMEGLGNIPIHVSNKSLGDFYNPLTKELTLSQDVYSQASISALGIAAHEVGHAIQHSKKYPFLIVRTAFYPVANFSSFLAPILLIAGIFFSRLSFSTYLLEIGIILFSASVVFTVVTLPVEFNASRRAVQTLKSMGILHGDDEIKGVKKVLNAAALTYVAAALVAILQLIRLILIAKRR